MAITPLIDHVCQSGRGFTDIRYHLVRMSVAVLDPRDTVITISKEFHFETVRFPVVLRMRTRAA